MTTPLRLSPEQAKALETLKVRGNANNWAAPSTLRKQKAISLYLESRSKNHVCKTLHMARKTLNSILDEAGVDI